MANENVLLNLTKAFRGASGTTQILEAQYAEVAVNEQFRQAFSNFALPRRNFPIAADADITVFTENITEWKNHLTASGVEILALNFKTEKDGVRAMKPHVERNGAGQFTINRPEGGKVTLFGLKFKVVGLTDASTIATEMDIVAP